MVNGRASGYSIRSTDFLMGLGSLYLQNNLPGPAEELLVQIPPGDSNYPFSAELQIEIQSRKQNYREAIRLGETLANRPDIPPWVLERIGTAHYFLGETSNAKSYLLESMKHVPENCQVREKIQFLRPSDRRSKVEELVMGGFDIGITPHVVLDCITPVLWGGRFASCCFSDQLLLDNQPENSDSGQQDPYLEFAANLYQRFGIFTAYLPYVDLSLNQCVPLVKVFFSLDPLVFDRVEDIRQSAWGEFDKHGRESNDHLEYMEKEGSLLGYPRCCIEWALGNRRSDKSIEALALEALIEEEYVCSLEAAKTPPPQWAYFAYEFYPCGPRCAAAEQVGIGIFERYKKTEVLLSDLYCQYMLPRNKAKMYHSQTPYSYFIDDFNQSIIRVLKIEDFKKTHEDFESYREDMIAIFKERPDLDGHPDGLSIVYKMAKERAVANFSMKKKELTN